MKKETTEQAKKIVGRTSEVLGATIIGAESAIAADTIININQKEDEYEPNNNPVVESEEATVEPIDPNDIIIEEDIISSETIVEHIPVNEPTPITESNNIVTSENLDVINVDSEQDIVEDVYAGPGEWDVDPNEITVIDIEPDMYGGPTELYEEPTNYIAENNSQADDILNDILNA